MNNTFRVAVNWYDFETYNDIGYIEYYIQEKKADIFLKSEQAKKSVTDFLAKSLTLQIPHKTMHDFTSVTINPLDNLDNFKLALTRLWEYTNVYVNWSRPVDYVIEHMD